MDRLDRKDLKDAAFDVVLRGYDKRQVDERFRFLGAELIAAENALRAASQRAAKLEDALSESRAAPVGEPSGDSSSGARVEKMLKLAEGEAREVRHQADAAAAALLDQARAQAAEQDSALRRRFAELDSARQELDRARQEVERESERVRAQTQADVDQIRKAVAHCRPTRPVLCDHRAYPCQDCG
jgi:chromosome segregation ATPase